MTSYVDLYIDQGATFNHIINLIDDITNEYINVSGFQVSSQMRRSHFSPNSSAEIVCTITNPEAGEITLSMPYETTANLRPGRYVFDVVSINTENIASRILEGCITVTPSVTR
jgi:hypothetical protein